MKFKWCFIFLIAVNASYVHAGNTYDDLLVLFKKLRALEQTNTNAGVPDYTAVTMSKNHEQLKTLQAELSKFDTTGWSLEQKIDFEIVRAEMNGFDFFIRVLQPWARDPAYYALVWAEQSDTPEHEGPVSHAAIDVWKYSYPLSKDDEKKLAGQLKVIPPLLEQARTNLTGNARDLWIAGTQTVRSQLIDLDDLAKQTAGAGKEFKDALKNAREATVRFAEWLDQEAPKKTGPSGVGKENYTWFIRHVLLVPLSWEEEVTLLKRELDRAYSMLALERHHNRKLSEIIPAASPNEYDQRADSSIKAMMKFFKDEEIFTVKNYMEPALRKHLGGYQPEASRNFFSKIMHAEPNVLYSHSIHWIDLARMKEEPHSSPIRKDALPFNIWASRSEGFATGAEELFMHAGLYDGSARARELVWIMLAQRCARGLASLYAHANQISLSEAREFQRRWTPDGWVGEQGLIAAEQQLYLRLPGYGTCYVSGKYLIERLTMDRSRQLGGNFKLKKFLDEFFNAGQIPVSLIRWQMTGLDDEIKAMTNSK